VRQNEACPNSVPRCGPAKSMPDGCCFTMRTPVSCCLNRGAPITGNG
jgi:hypothetical protein